MSKQNPSEQINKASWTLAEGIKDAVINNVTQARTLLKIDDAALNKLLAIIGASVEEGYHRGARVFDRVVATTIKSVEAEEAKVWASQVSKKSPKAQAGS